MKLFLFCVVTGFVFLLPAIFSGTAATVAAESGSAIIHVSDKDNGNTVSMAARGILEMKLETIPGTGYAWQVIRNDSRILRMTGPPVLAPADETREKMLGAPSYQVFRFEAQAAGKSILELHYKRRWEAQAAPLKTFVVTVRVN